MTCDWLIGNLGMLMQENRTADMVSDFLLVTWVHQCLLKTSFLVNQLIDLDQHLG